jgi:CheY-like chemotaxis protein
MIKHMAAGLRLSESSARSTGMPLRGSGKLEGVPLGIPVLIVEDEAMIAWMIESLLEDMGFTSISVAASGGDAIAKAARIHPGLVISDINLGQGCLDGIDTARAILGLTAAPFVFVTGHAGAGERERIARYVPGAHVLRKPITVDILRRTIALVLCGRDMH